jgi:hypothetical protein
MRRLVTAILFVGVFTFSATQVHACWCGVGGVADSFKRARAVFLGDVLDIAAPKTTDPDAPLQDRLFTITFTVAKTWKGVPAGAREFKVLSGQGRSPCSRVVHAGQRYLVFANGAYQQGGEDPVWDLISTCNRMELVDFTWRNGDSIRTMTSRRLTQLRHCLLFKLDFRPTLRWKPAR